MEVRLLKCTMPEVVDEVLIAVEDGTKEETVLEIVSEVMGEDWVDANIETLLTAEKGIPGLDTMRPYTG